MALFLGRSLSAVVKLQNHLASEQELYCEGY